MDVREIRSTPGRTLEQGLPRDGGAGDVRALEK